MKLTGNIGRTRHWIKVEGATTDELLTLAVARGVADSLDYENAKRTVWGNDDWPASDDDTDGTTGDKIFLHWDEQETYTPGLYEARNETDSVTFDPLADLADDERLKIGAAIAEAFTTRPKFTAEIIAQQVYADGVATLPELHSATLTAALTAYRDEVSAGACPTAALAAQLRSLGEQGTAYADILEADEGAIGDPLLVWFNPRRPGLAGFLMFLTRAIWHDVIRPAMERAEKNARNVGAVTLGTYGTLEALMFTKNTRVVTNDRQAELFVDEKVTATAHLSDIALVDVLTKATPALRSLAAVQFLVWIIDEVKRRHFLGFQYPNIVTIEGGLGAVADAAAFGASKSRESLLRQILTAGKDWNVAWPNGSEVHGLWTFNTTPPAPGRPSTVTITVAAPLTPHGGGGGILTPIVTVNDLEGITNRKYFGPLAAFKQGVVKAIVDRRLELPKHGGALITDRDLATLAARCGISSSKVVSSAMQAWQIDRDEGAQFLEVHKGRYHIANNDEYGAVRAFIDESASIATTASKRGKRGAAKRAKITGKK